MIACGLMTVRGQGAAEGAMPGGAAEKRRQVDGSEREGQAVEELQMAAHKRDSGIRGSRDVVIGRAEVGRSPGKGTGRVPGASVQSLRWPSMVQERSQDHEAHRHRELRT